MTASAGLFYHVRQLEQLVRRHVDECLRPEGLTAGQFHALGLIVHQGSMSAAKLARLTDMTAQSMGQFIRALQDKGFIERAADPDHPRAILIHATAEGRAALARGEAAIDAAERRLFGCLSKEEVAHLRFQIARVRRAAEAGDAPA